MRCPSRRPAPSPDALDTTSSVPAPRTPAPPEAWRQLEPLRTIRPVELTADGRRFSRGLGVRQPAELALRPLGHTLSLDAPRGIVSTLTRPVVASDRELDLPLATPRREQPSAPVAPRSRLAT